MKNHRLFIKKHLLRYGSIRRNYLLQNYISRGAEYIRQLREEGMEIEGKKLKTKYGEDFVYILKNKVTAHNLEEVIENHKEKLEELNNK